MAEAGLLSFHWFGKLPPFLQRARWSGSHSSTGVCLDPVWTETVIDFWKNHRTIKKRKMNSGLRAV
jgi:hypothetical protein